MRKKTITLEIIAKDLGLSKTTISRVISGKGRISFSTREKVLNYIKVNDYRPNSLARSLAQQRTNNIGLVIPNNTSTDEMSFFQECMIGLAEYVVQYDFDTLVVVTAENDLTCLERIVSNHKVDGVVLTRISQKDKEIPYLNKEGIPFVLIGTPKDLDNKNSIYHIDTNQKKGCCEITKHLINTGCKKIALLAGNKNFIVDQIRYEGFKRAFFENNLKISDELVFWDCMENKYFEELIENLIISKIDGIICMDDNICRRLLKITDKKSISIPSKIQVASFYDNAILERHYPSITSLHVDIKSLSAKAGKIIINIINKEECKYHNIVDYSIKYRESTF